MSTAYWLLDSLIFFLISVILGLFFKNNHHNSICLVPFISGVMSTSVIPQRKSSYTWSKSKTTKRKQSIYFLRVINYDNNKYFKLTLTYDCLEKTNNKLNKKVFTFPKTNTCVINWPRSYKQTTLFKIQWILMLFY